MRWRCRGAAAGTRAVSTVDWPSSPAQQWNRPVRLCGSRAAVPGGHAAQSWAGLSAGGHVCFSKHRIRKPESLLYISAD